MTHYDVIATVRADLVDRWLEWMRREHIPALLATGCFRTATLARDDRERIRIRYSATDRAAVQAYLDHHAPRLRADGAVAFPDGVTFERELWEELPDA